MSDTTETHNPHPYDLGRTACDDQHACNPFPYMSDDWTQWRQGVIDGLADNQAELFRLGGQ